MRATPLGLAQRFSQDANIPRLGHTQSTDLVLNQQSTEALTKRETFANTVIKSESEVLAKTHAENGHKAGLEKLGENGELARLRPESVILPSMQDSEAVC